MTTSTRDPLPYTVYRTPRARPPRREPGWRRARRILLTAGLLCLIPALVSFIGTMTRPSNSSFFINSVEWMRSNGARPIVNAIENEYYSLTAPAKGGPALKKLSQQKGALAAKPAPVKVVHYYRPPNIVPLTKGLPGEGVWQPTFAGGGSRPPVLITQFRPDPVDYPQAVVGVAWIDHTRTSVQLYPGMQEPSVPMANRGPEAVPMSLRSQLVATFNSGFKLQDSGGGFVYNGHTYAPMVNGLSAIVRYTNGSINVIDWSFGHTAPPNIVWARQNLPLIVSGGKPNPNLNDSAQWGATLGNAALVWRSAVGVDSHGNLIYAAGPDQGLNTLASTMIHAGAVRAMELDINTYWTSLITYRYPGAKGAANLLSSMDRSPLRYLTPDDRDFFAVYLH